MKSKTKKRKTMTQITKESEMKKEQQVNRISALHFEKLQVQLKKEDQINKVAAELFQMELSAKNRRSELEAFTVEVQKEGVILNNELSQTYGNVRINPETGEITNQE